MDVPQNIGKYKISCLISTLLQRRFFIATDPKGTSVILKESIDRNQIYHEYEILAKLNFESIIKPIELIECNNKYYLVLPRAENDLSEFMKSEIISEKTVRQIMFRLLSAVQYLNVMGIWHRNINPQNILVFNDNQEKKFVLADFKLAINFTGINSDDFRADYQYMAPEISENKGYTNKIDSWSCGVVMYQLFKHTYPFKDESSPKTDPIDMTDIPLDAADLITHLLCVDPEMRYSASDALKHHFFK